MYTARVFHKLFLIAIIFISYSMLSAQIKIKERVEISPTQNTKLPVTIRADFQDITIPPIDPIVTALGPGGGFIYGVECEDPDADEVFVPRIGGILSIALCECDGSATGDLHSEVLLIFGPDGRVKNAFPLSDLDSIMTKSSNGSFHIWDPCRSWWFDLQTNENSIIWFNPWAFNEAGYEKAKQLYGHADSANYWYPPAKMEVDVRSWEPIRFRIYSPTTGNLYKALNCFYKAMPQGYSPGNWTQLPDVLVFRTADWDTIRNIDYSTVFPMGYSTDSSKVGGGPSSVQCSDTYFFTPDSGFYRVIIGNVLPNVTGTLSVIDTMPHILVTDIRSHQGDTILIGPYSEGTLLRFDLDGMCQSGGQDYYASGGVSFESWTDYDFQDAAIWFEYAAQPVDHLELWSTTSTIYYGDTVDIEIVPCGADSLFSPLGEDYNYEFSIELTGETSRYVELIYEDESSDHFDHVYSYNRRGADIRLAANKEEPDSVVNLTFHLKAKYIGQGGIATSMGRIPAGEARTGVLMKQTADNSKNTFDYKDGKITINIGAQKKTFDKIGIKRLQSLYSANTRRIGRPVITEERKIIPNVSLSKKKILASTMEGETDNVWLENDWGARIEEPIEILLGETQYYGARVIQTRMGQRLQIERAIISDDGIPFLSGGENNVDYVCVSRSGNECGVYHEKQYPVWQGDKFIEMKHLSAGLIRLVGRYWNSEQEHKVTLLASSIINGKPVFGHINFKVTKPAKLGETHSKVLNVYSEPGNLDYDLDDIIIKYAGEKGVPPQFLKGQIEKESNFIPGYRWEPFAELKYNWHKKNKKGEYISPYMQSDFPYDIISASDIGTPTVPPNGPQPGHRNVYPNYYWGFYGTTGTIWELLYDHSSDLNAQVSLDLYPSYNSNNIQIWPDKVINDYNDFYENAFFNSFIVNWGNVSVASTIAHETANAWLHYIYADGRLNEVAQTRTASSYGFLQIMYSTAEHDQEYEINGENLPENLQIPEIEFEYAVPYLCDRLSDELETQNDNNDSNWTLGFENTWRIAFSRYNKPGLKDATERERLEYYYGNKVINLSNQYKSQ